MLTPGRTRIVEVDPDVTIAFGPRIAITVWRKDVTIQNLLVLGRELRAFVPGCRGQGYASVTVIEPGISLRMDNDVRTASEGMQREFAQHIKCMAYLVTQEGWVAAAARTVASGFAFATRAPYPLKVFATAPETALWVGRFLDWPADDVARLLSEARTPRPLGDGAMGKTPR